MSTARLYRTEGIIIRRRDQGEADRVLTLCTPEGKIEIIAKGARKVRSRKAGHIELFCRASFVVSRVRNSWDIISQAETVESHHQLRSDLVRGTYARYVVELADRFFAQGEGGPALFDLLNHTLTWLCEGEDADLVARFYEQHLLALAGFRPELFRCVGEHERALPLDLREGPEDNRPYGFDPELGGVLCADCYAREGVRREVIAISTGALRFLRECQKGPFGRLSSLPVTPALREEVERAMGHYITYHLERDVKAGAFLRQLRREGQVRGETSPERAQQL